MSLPSLHLLASVTHGAPTLLPQTVATISLHCSLSLLLLKVCFQGLHLSNRTHYPKCLQNISGPWSESKKIETRSTFSVLSAATRSTCSLFCVFEFSINAVKYFGTMSQSYPHSSFWKLFFYLSRVSSTETQVMLQTPPLPHFTFLRLASACLRYRELVRRIQMLYVQKDLLDLERQDYYKCSERLV